MLLYSKSHFKRALQTDSGEFKFSLLFWQYTFYRMSRNNVKTPVTVISNVYHLQIIHKWSMVAMWSLNRGLFSRKTNTCYWKYKRVHCKKKPLVAYAETYSFCFYLKSKRREHFWKNLALLFIHPEHYIYMHAYSQV